MKKLYSYLLLSSIAFPLIAGSAKATPENTFNPITSNPIGTQSPPYGSDQCDNFLTYNNMYYERDCITESIAPAINKNHENIVENNTLIDSNTSNISTNTSNISTNTSDISTNTSNISTNTSAIETLQGSSNTANISANTNKINTNTSNINSLGEGVAGSTALTAALSALPQMSKESKTTCGVGTGAYSSRYAVGFGCASKVSKRIDVNAGGSYVFGGSKSYGGGTLDSGVVKAGFVFKLGELNKPTQISFHESKELKNEVKDLKAKNNQLLARLEKLENIALKFQTNLDEISMSK